MPEKRIHGSVARIIRPLFIALFAALLLTLLPAGNASGNYQSPNSRGLFGAIVEITTNHPRAVAGETDFTLDTPKGREEFTATLTTEVRIPGREFASLDDLLPGDPVAVLADGGRAVSILVRADQPVRTRHFTGVVTFLDDDQEIVGLQSRHGQHISAPVLEVLPGLRLGELVTAVLEQDLSTGGLVITGLDRAAASLERITSAMELAERSGAGPDLMALRERLIGNSTHHITTIQEASQKAAPALRSRIKQDFDSTLEAYSRALADADSGGPAAEITGIITSISREQQRVVVESPGLEPVEVSITDRTGLWRAPIGLPFKAAEVWLRGGADTQAHTAKFGGKELRFDQLDLASRVRIWYGLETGSATRVLVLPGDSLQTSKTELLLSLAGRGEAAGMVLGVDSGSVPATITIEDEISGTTITLNVSPETSMLVDATPEALAALTGASVAATYDPKSSTILELSAMSQVSSQSHFYGVVHSFIPKVLPGNIVIVDSEGGLRAFNHTADTEIVRDGRRVTISQIRIGDLVRPNSHYQIGSDSGAASDPGEDILLLNLKSPENSPVQGTIRGIELGPDGGTLLTITNNWLEVANVTISDQTRLTGQGGSQGGSIEVGEIFVGQRVLSGTYDPISTIASRIVVGPPKSLRIKGEITSVDATQSAITITPKRGDPVRLLVLESTPVRIILRGITDPYFGDLEEGQTVRIGFYDPATNQAIKLVVG